MGTTLDRSREVFVYINTKRTRSDLIEENRRGILLELLRESGEWGMMLVV
jgi:hypothetical protein